MTLEEGARAAARKARRLERLAFHARWGFFLKCSTCGARTTWCDDCDQTIAPTIRPAGYSPPPVEP